jgi:hypothetical protein
MFAFSSPLRYNSLVPTARSCVSFTDSENICHCVEVVASTLYLTATLASAKSASRRSLANGATNAGGPSLHQCG